MLTRLIYASRAAENVSIAEVSSIISAATRNNSAEGVTGILFFDRTYFLQCLEGKRSALNHIYNKITADPRHTDITLIKYCEVSQRLFHSWSMAYLSAQDDNIKNLVKNYSPNKQFKPCELAANQANNLISDFSTSLARKSSFETSYQQTASSNK